MNIIWILAIFTGFLPSAWGLESTVVAPESMKAQSFVEGAPLGDGVVEKEFDVPTLKTPAKIPVKYKKIVALKKIQAPARSIASYPEDTKFSNEDIQKVREKDSSDRAETLALVRAAIERGEFGKAAKVRLENQK